MYYNIWLHRIISWVYAFYLLQKKRKFYADQNIFGFIDAFLSYYAAEHTI